MPSSARRSDLDYRKVRYGHSLHATLVPGVLCVIVVLIFMWDKPGHKNMPRQALADACREIAELAGRGVLTRPVAARYPLAECANAHRHQESGAALGNVLISVREPDGPRPAPAGGPGCSSADGEHRLAGQAALFQRGQRVAELGPVGYQPECRVQPAGRDESTRTVRSGPGYSGWA